MDDQRVTSAAHDLLKRFEEAGAVRIEPGYLQPAEVLLDLYGEDIRARAYRTDDPVFGEQMLRPDFTVPVVQAHMESGQSGARYTYAGPVWRRQDFDSDRAREFWQVGAEIIGDSDQPRADAEIFKLIADALGDLETRPVTGDLALIFGAINALKTSEARKTALRRHVWRPARFQSLLDRFSGRKTFDCDTREHTPSDAPPIGLRRLDEIEARIAALKEERDTPDLSDEELSSIQTLLQLRGSVAACAAGLEAVARAVPGLKNVAENFAARAETMTARGIDIDDLRFDGSFGRRSMEYYDGFTFEFRKPDGQVVAQGGRYDALTRVLGRGASIPAVGGVIRPDQML